MFITLKYESYKELIPISSIIKFANTSERYELTLSEIVTTKNFIWNYGDVKNKVVEIDQQSQPLAFAQIQNYLANQFN
jgi:hypothetical protein